MRDIGAGKNDIQALFGLTFIPLQYDAQMPVFRRNIFQAILVNLNSVI